MGPQKRGTKERAGPGPAAAGPGRPGQTGGIWGAAEGSSAAIASARTGKKTKLFQGTTQLRGWFSAESLGRQLGQL